MKLEKKAVSGMMLTLLLTSMLTLAFNVHQVKTELSPLTVLNERASWQQIWVYETDVSPNCVSVSPDGSYIAVGSSGKVYFLDSHESLLWSYPTDFPIVDISMTADVSRIVAGGSKGVVIPDGIVYCLNEGGELLWSIESGGVSSVSMAPDGKYFAMTYVHWLGWNDVVALWGFIEEKWLWYYIFGRAQTDAVSVSADGEYIAVGGAADPYGEDGGVRLYDKGGNLLWEYAIDTTTLGGDKYSVSISSDGKYVAAGNRGNNSFYFFDRDQGLVWSYNTEAVRGVCVSEGGTYIAAATSNAVYLFDRHMNLLWTSEIENLEDVAISADGTMIVAVAKDNRVYAFASAPLNKPPTCVITLQKDGVEINEIDVWEFFDIYVGVSTDDTGIKQVRFSSDDFQDGVPTGEWTEWYDWDVSSGDWNASTKIKRWAFATGGDKEVWAEVKDDAGQTAKGSANIYATPILIPGKDVPAEAPDFFPSVLTKLNIPTSQFAVQALTIWTNYENTSAYWNPLATTWDMGEKSWNFNEAGVKNYVDKETGIQATAKSLSKDNKAYDYKAIRDMLAIQSFNEQNLRDAVAYWTFGTNFASIPDLDLNKPYVVNLVNEWYELYQEIISELEDKINRRLQQRIIYSHYLIDEDSWSSALTEVWMKFTDWITRTDLTERYKEFYWASVDYDYMRVKALISARDFLEMGDIINAQKYLKKSYIYEKSSAMSFEAAAEAYMDNLEVAEILAQGIKEGSQASVEFGLSVINPTAAKVADYIYLGVDYAVNSVLSGQEQAVKNIVVEGMITAIFNDVEFEVLGGRTITEYTKNRIGKYVFPMLKEAFKSEELQFALSKIIKQIGVELEQKTAEDLLKFVMDELQKFNLEQIKVDSPIEVRVISSHGNVTGLINKQVKHEIPMSVYNNGTVTVFFPTNTYRYEVVGTDTGTYRLEITSVVDGNATIFTATDIPTSANAIHQYSINWTALSQGEEGVTVQIDSDGDGTFEKSFTADSELTQNEFMLQVSPVEAFPIWIVGVAIAIVAVVTVATAVFWRRQKQLSTRPEVAPPKSPAEVKYCTKCGASIPLDATHCTKCGQKQH